MSSKNRSVSLAQSDHRYAIYRHIFAHSCWWHFTHWRSPNKRRLSRDVARKNANSMLTVALRSRRQVDRRSKVMGSQTAEPQRVAATTTVVHSSAATSADEASSASSSMRKYLGNRSPSGQSPVTKSRKTPHNANLSIGGGGVGGAGAVAAAQSSSGAKDADKEIGSPKSRTWKGLVARQFRKIQGTPSAQASNYVVLPEGASVGVPLALCPMVSGSSIGI